RAALEPGLRHARGLGPEEARSQGARRLQLQARRRVRAGDQGNRPHEGVDRGRQQGRGQARRSRPVERVPVHQEIITRQPEARGMALPSLERKQYKLGKYDIVAQPLLGSAHMLRYTVMLNGKRIDALMSVPNESDCRFMEAPPPVPPLRIFALTNRPGRPK